ncbi:MULTISPECIES: nuclear transport factor 2 family protein [unclassified Luteococcus]|uniref:nuclear transport factor 2 family protein n=1 Tax=unclassified Luteococcus TaxID=2639923 RepID=UPI00313DD544
MNETVEELVRLNQQIGHAECAADEAFFEDLLCPQFVMQRPTGRLDDRAALIAGLSTGASRVTSDVQVTLHPDNRAVVTCLVTKWDGAAEHPPADAASFHNLRIFIRTDAAAPWQLLAWLNEPAAAD